MKKAKNSKAKTKPAAVGMSAAGRKRIGDAQRKRWIAYRESKQQAEEKALLDRIKRRKMAHG